MCFSVLPRDATVVRGSFHYLHFPGKETASEESSNLPKVTQLEKDQATPPLRALSETGDMQALCQVFSDRY